MKSKLSTIIATVTLLAAFAIPVQPAAQQQLKKKFPPYSVTDLGTLGGTFSQVLGINNNGSVVGFATLTGDTALHVFFGAKER